MSQSDIGKGDATAIAQMRIRNWETSTEGSKKLAGMQFVCSLTQVSQTLQHLNLGIPLCEGELRRT